MKIKRWNDGTIGAAANPDQLTAQSWVYGPLLGFDLETTGTDPYSCHTVDMALVLDMADGSPPDVHQWLINPGVEIPLGATAIHGINTDTAREKGIPVSVAIAELAYTLEVITGALGTLPVCVYNAAYDIPILLRESGLAVGLDWQILDGMILDKALDKYRSGKRTLTSVSAAHGLNVRNAHRAAGDAVSALRVARAIGERHPMAGNTPVAELHKMQAAAYREQMEQFQNYERNEDPEFECPVNWPYDPDMLSAAISGR